MSSVLENKDYYEKYDWSSGGEEWSAPWGGTRSMWLASIYPRIGKFLPAEHVVEIGSGNGRIAKVLHAFTASQLVLFDIVDDCVAVCSKVFEESSKTKCLKTDGGTLRGVADNSIDLVFSFYSLVGADADTIGAYMREFDRVLGADGVAFLHHSNAASYYDPNSAQQDKRMRLLAAYRDISVDAQKVQQLAQANNLVCIRQECVNWDLDEVLTDCFSTIVRPDSIWACEPELVYNPGFRFERELAAMRARKTSPLGRHTRRVI